MAFAAFSSLRDHRNFRLFFNGQVISVIGTWIQSIGMTWVVISLTHSAVSVGVLALCQFLPNSVFGLFVGALIDRFDPHRVVLTTQAILLAIACLFAALTLGGWITVEIVYVLAVAIGCINVLDAPSRQALTLAIVGRKDLANAVGLNSSVWNVGGIVGPAVGGVLIARFGVEACFVVNAVSFGPLLVSLAVIRGDELAERRPPAERPRVLAGTLEALRFSARTPAVAISLLAVFALSTLSSNVNVLVPLLATDTLHGGAQTYGVIAACLGAGSAIGGLLTAARGRASWGSLLAGAAGMGIAEVLLIRPTSVVLVAALLFGLGVCYTLWTSNASSSLQLASPAHLQGRAIGLYYFAFLAGAPIGGWLSGWLVHIGGTQLGFGVAGGAALATSVTAATARHRYRGRIHSG